MIKDSGERKSFETGAVRDVSEGKGRMDLLPIDMLIRLLSISGCDQRDLQIVRLIQGFETEGDEMYLLWAAKTFIEAHMGTPFNGVLEYSKHMEEGALKYDPRNWERGIPLERYIDSGLRHFMKFLNGETDERHDRAFVWNMICGAWTCKHKPELNGYKRVKNEM